MAAPTRVTLIVEDIDAARSFAADAVNERRAARALFSPPLDSIRRGPDGIEAVTEYRIDLDTTIDFVQALRLTAAQQLGQDCHLSVTSIREPSPAYARAISLGCR